MQLGPNILRDNYLHRLFLQQLECLVLFVYMGENKWRAGVSRSVGSPNKELHVTYGKITNGGG